MYQVNVQRNQLVVDRLKQQFGEEVILAEELLADMLCLTVATPHLFNLLYFLQIDQPLRFNFLTTLCGMHFPDKEQLGVVYHLHSFENNHRIRIKAYAPVEEPVFPTITTLWPSANWMEREAFEFFGIQFDGHPNLKRILNVDDFEGFPLRKDFPLEDPTREDKDDRFFGR